MNSNPQPPIRCTAKDARNSKSPLKMATASFVEHSWVLCKLTLVLLLGRIPSTATTSCENPVVGILSDFSTFEWDFTPSITILSENDDIFVNSIQATSKSYLISVSKVLNWEASIDKIYDSNKTINQYPLILIIPPNLNSSTYLLSYVAKKESSYRKTRLPMPRVFFVWPECPGGNIFAPECYTEGAAEDGQVVSKIPQISSEIYIATCESNTTSDGEVTQELRIVTLHQMGRGNVIRVKLRDWDNIFNHYFYNWDFQGGQLNAIFRALPRQEIDFHVENGSGKINVTGGLVGNVMLYIEEALNCSINYTKGEGWNEENGVASQLEDGKVDIVTEKITYLPHRRATVQSITPIYAQGIQVFFQQPPASSIRDIFTQPFQRDLWLTLVAVWVLVTLSSFAAAKIKSLFKQVEENDEEISKDSILWAIGFTCQQGWHIDPEAISLKIIFLSGSALGLIVYVAYSAALVSALSAIVTPIKTFSDLLDSSLSVTYDPKSSSIDFILKDEAVKNSLLKRKLVMPSADAGVRKVFDSNTAILIFPDLFYSIAKNDMRLDDRYLCSTVTHMRVNNVPFKSGMFLAKGSPFAEFVNLRLITMFENGVLFRMLRHYFLSFRGDCEVATVRSDVGLGLSDVFTAFVIMGIGYLLSLTVLVMEKLYAMADKTGRLEKTTISSYLSYT